MVSFQCEGCADTVKKPKLDSHRQRCHATFTCIDCSTTFHNFDYRGHTSCISEAEKYEGALYKGSKKDKKAQKANGHAVSTAAPAFTAPESSAPPTPSASSPGGAAIHPSRQAAISASSSGPSGSSTSYSAPNRGGYAGRGGYGFAGRGGNFGNAGRNGYGPRPAGTAENAITSKGGMRSWGTNTPVEGTPQPQAASPIVGSSAVAAASTAGPAGQVTAGGAAAANGGLGAEEEPAKKKRKGKKGDKGGTGSKANSSKLKAVPVEPTSITAVGGNTATATSEVDGMAASSKEAKKKASKRKRDDDEPPAGTSSSSAQQTPASAPIVSEKTLKRLRKNFSKLSPASKSTSSGNGDGRSGFTLSDLVEKLAKGKKDSSMDVQEVMKGLQVAKVDGRWVLTV